jgi:SAM-dependent methyltransferase
MAELKETTLYHGADYKEFWTGPTKSHIDAIERRIIEKALTGGESIAEIGAGYGRLATSYLDRYRHVYLVEPAESLREQAAESYGDMAKCVDASVYDLPFEDGTLDALLMVRVMHHLTDPYGALAELWRVLTPGGHLLFSYSNKRNVGKLIKFLLGGGNDPYSADVERYGEFLFGHHPTYMDGIVKDAGFERVDQYGVGLAGKVVDHAPSLSSVLVPPLALAGGAGRLALSPTLFWLLRKP